MVDGLHPLLPQIDSRLIQPGSAETQWAVLNCSPWLEKKMSVSDLKIDAVANPAANLVDGRYSLEDLIDLGF